MEDNAPIPIGQAVPDEGLQKFAQEVIGITTLADAISLARRVRCLEIVEGAAENLIAERDKTQEAGADVDENTDEEVVAQLLQERGNAERFAEIGLRAAVKMSQEAMQGTPED